MSSLVRAEEAAGSPQDFIDLGALPAEEATVVVNGVARALMLEEGIVKSDEDTWDRSDRRRVFIRVYSPAVETLRGMGADVTLRKSVSQALVEIITNPSWRDLGRVSQATLVVELERAYHPIYPNPADLVLPTYDPLGHTIYVQAGGRQSSVTPLDYLSHSHSPLKEMDRAESLVSADRGGRIQLIKADTYVRLPFREDVISLWRAHAPVERMDRKRIAEAVNQAARYMTRFQNADGSFPPVYFPLYDASARGILEPESQALAVFALSRLATETGTTDFDLPLDKAVEFLSGKIVYPPDESRKFMCVPTGKHATASAAALTVIALDEYSRLRKTDEYDRKMDRLMDFLDSLIQTGPERGGVIDVYYFESELESAPALNRSYPLEVVSALVRYYERTSDERWLTLAGNVADFAVLDREEIFPHLPLRREGWLAIGLLDLLRVSDGDVNVRSHWCSIALRNMMERQFRPAESPFLEFIGGFWQREAHPVTEGEFEVVGEPDSTTTADALLALLYAQRHWPASFELPKEIPVAAVGAQSFLLLQQFTPADSFYLKDPSRAVGGLRQNWSKCEIYLETVATAIAAFSYYGSPLPPAGR